LEVGEAEYSLETEYDFLPEQHLQFIPSDERETKIIKNAYFKSSSTAYNFGACRKTLPKMDSTF